MAMVLAFAPFIVFAVVDRVVGSLAGLAAAAIVALILLARDCLVTAVPLRSSISAPHHYS
jgi:hypothetical protein